MAILRDMKNAFMFGAMLFLTACPKGGSTMSTETGGPGGGGGDTGGGGGGAVEGARSFGDTDGMSLEERKYWKGEDDYLFRNVDEGKDKCGVTFTVEWVGRKQFRAEVEKTNHSPYGVCDAIVAETVSLCREGEDEKSSVAAKIKGFRCGYGKPRTLTMDNGIVVYMGNNEESNFSDWAKPWLMKNL